MRPASRAATLDGRPRPQERAMARIEEAYELFGNQRDGVVKVAITP